MTAMLLIAFFFGVVFGQLTEYSRLLPICSYTETSINDLYSPMTIGYQLIKRGFCLVYNNGPLDKPVAEPTPEEIAARVEGLSNQATMDYTSVWQKTIASLSESQIAPNVVENNYKPYHPVLKPGTKNIYKFPIVLANGMCLDNMSPVRYLENKKVSCLLPISTNVNQLLGNFSPTTTPWTCYEILFKTYTKIGDCNSLSQGRGIRRIELNITVSNEAITAIALNAYFESVTSDYSVTYDVSFKNITSFQRSGNPGYIQSYPLLSASMDGTSKITKYLEKILFNGANVGSCVDSLTNPPLTDYSNFFYEPNMDNSFSFERSILYGCSFSNTNPTLLLFNDILGKTFNSISQFGNGKPEILNDWIQIVNNIQTLTFTCTASPKCQVPFVTMNILYADVGALNNTQSGIMRVEYKTETIEITPSTGTNPGRAYFKVNFFKQPLTSTRWYAPGPGFFRLPRNIMYPFRIGSTTYAGISSSHYLHLNPSLLILTSLALLLFS